MIILLSRDLFFSSKITGTAKLLNIPMRVAETLEVLADVLADSDKQARAIILDLGSGISPSAVAAALTHHESVTCVAFGPHVDVEALRAARDAGFDAVLPRSRFSADLPKILRQMAPTLGDS